MSGGSVAPRVSVVLAVRDAVDRLAEALDSVLSQRGVELELIAVDDGSVDGTAELLSQRAALDARLRVVRQPASGLTAALRAGCALAKGELVARQDAGDVSLPDRLRRQAVAFAEHPRLALASCFTECRAPRGEWLYVDRGRAEPGVERSLFGAEGVAGDHVGPTSHGSAMFRRELYERAGGYREEFALAQDWDLWLRLGELGTYLTLGDVLYRRTLTTDSISSRWRDVQIRLGEAATQASWSRRQGDSEEGALARARAESLRFWALRGRGGGRAGGRARALACYHFGEVLRRNGDGGARAYLIEALRAWPLLARAWGRLLQEAVGARGTR